jgi:uncharacterized protein (DUF58 family)
VNPRALRAALLAGKRRPRRWGAGSPTQYRGDGYEFVELREYVPGDDPRRIDWAATARSNALQTRVVLEDVALTLAAVCDTSASMNVGRARTLADAAQEARAAWFACALPSDRTIAVREPQADMAAHFRTAKAMLPRGAALLAITDGFGLVEDARTDDSIAALGDRCDCTLLLAEDPWIDGLPLRGFTCMRDAETGERAWFYIGARHARAFADAARARRDALVERFARRNWRTALLRESDGAGSLYAAFA